MSLFCTETEKLLSAGWYYIWLWLMLHFQSTIMSTRSVWFIFKAFGAFSNANSLIWIKSLNSSYLLFNHSDFSNSIFNGNQWQIQQSRRVDQRGHCHLTYHNLSRKPWQKTCLMHFALWESCSFFFYLPSICLQAETALMPYGYRYNYFVCFGARLRPTSVLLSLNTVSRWQLKCTAWIWILDCALHFETAGFAARKLWGDWCASQSRRLNLGDQRGRKGSDMNKSTSVCGSLIHTLRAKPPSPPLIYSCYRGADA